VSDVTAWRIVLRRRAEEVWRGEGAFRRGGRWSPPGVRVVYAAESRALAVLEILVHVQDLADLSASTAIDDVGTLSKPWREFPHGRVTQQIGAAWAKSGRFPVLRVPSAVVEGEFNYVLNPAHPGFGSVRLGKPAPFRIDPRLG
jgi:RES domain-containing protein